MREQGVVLAATDRWCFVNSDVIFARTELDLKTPTDKFSFRRLPPCSAAVRFSPVMPVKIDPGSIGSLSDHSSHAKPKLPQGGLLSTARVA